MRGHFRAARFRSAFGGWKQIPIPHYRQGSSGLPAAHVLGGKLYHRRRGGEAALQGLGDLSTADCV